jgi:2-polyprenyl-3-methyl-5-hydroxy-6-metoxy-1,4-benzoquinol methylase
VSFRANGESCPGCGDTNLRRFRAVPSDVRGEPSYIAIIECGRCVLAWQWPVQHTTARSVAFFEQEYTNAEPGSYFDPVQQRAISELKYAFLASLRPNGGSLLDVGCGSGSFVDVAAVRGWRAVGIDPAARSGRTTSGAEIVNGTLDGLSGQQFDVVSLWDVIEHVEEPLALLAAAKRHLRADGFLLLETGNYQSAGRILGGEHWWDYQVDHRWYFGTKTLFALLQQVGLGRVIVSERVLRPHWRGHQHYPGPELLRHVKSAIKHPTNAFDELRTFLSLKKAKREWAFAGLEIVALGACMRE